MNKNEAVFMSLALIFIMSLGWVLSIRQEKEKSWYLQLTVTRMETRIELLEEYIQDHDLPTPAA